MKVLIVFHGMPPIAGRVVVGSGLRAFANGEALRAGGHQVVYCTRHEDLPGPIRAKAERLRHAQPLLLTSVTGPVAPPGERPRRPPLPDVGLSSTRRLDAVMAPAVGKAPGELSVRGMRAPDWSEGGALPPLEESGWTPSLGLAPVGGPLGAPGNPFAFTEPAELVAVVQRVDPDVVLVEALEDARHLPEGHFSVILDLFAPRILEQQFQTGSRDGRESVRVLDALQRADHFLFSNERQKYFHLSLLALAGVDCRKDAGDVVPISCPPDLPPVRKGKELTFVAGGVFWPWADLSAGLVDLLAILDELDLGAVQLYGGEYAIRSDTSDYVDPRAALPKDHARVSFAGMVPIDQLWDDYRKASVAFDLMAPNPEREINLSFRQVDYLRCGLPLITAPGQVIAPLVAQYGAGWLIEPGDRTALLALLRKLVVNPRLIAEAGAAAQRLAREHFAWDRTTKPLLAAVERPRRRQHGDTVIGQLSRTQADLWEEHAAAKRLRETTASQQQELASKSEEVRQADSKIRQLMTSVDRLTRSLEEVSRFRTDTVLYLQQEEDTALREAAELQRELDRRDVDLKKKQDALDVARKEVEKAQRTTADLLAQNSELSQGVANKDGEVLTLREQVQRLDERVQAEARGLAAARRELEGKRAALAEQSRLREAAEATALERLQHAETAARALLLEAATSLATARGTQARAEERALRLADRLATLEVDLAKKEQEAEAVSEAMHRERAEAGHARDQLTHAAKAERDALELRARADRQASEARTARQLDALRAEAEARLVAAQEHSEELLRDQLSRSATLDAERARQQSRAEQLAAQLGEADRRVQAAEAGLAGAGERQAEAARRADALHQDTLAKKEQEHLATRTRMEANHEATRARLEASHEAALRRLDERATAEADAAQERVEAIRTSLLALTTERDGLRARLATATAERELALAEAAKKEQEALQLAEVARRERLDAARTQEQVAERARTELAASERRAARQVELLRADAARGLELLRADAEARLGAARDEAELLLRGLLDRLAALDAERGRQQAKSEQLTAQLADADRRVKAGAGALHAATERHEAALSREREAQATLTTSLLAVQAEHALQRAAWESATRERDLARSEAGKKAAELSQLERVVKEERLRLVAEHTRRLEALQEALAEARATHDDAARGSFAALEAARAAGELARGEASRLKTELAVARMDAQKKQAEVEVGTAQRLAELAADNEKKTRALTEAQVARDALETQLLTAVAEGEERARALLAAVVARAEHDALGAASATERAAAERDAAKAENEQLRFEHRNRTAELAKKDRELTEGKARHVGLQAERDGLHVQIAELTVQVEQKDYAVRSLSTDADKKSRELADAQAQRNAMKAQLDEATEARRKVDETLREAGEALRAVERQRDAATLELAARRAEAEAPPPEAEAPKVRRADA